ncbi:cytochrome P450 [Herpetosiphon gulosus]|uniref:Pentalenene oxygenase n=1 Tax=Herpetosiphon gulosus TaxID=1973496 RepID=A0ABP9X8M0_9CHLR
MPTPTVLQTIPSMPRYPIIGNVGALRRDRLAFFQAVFDTCGAVGVFHFGSKPVLMVADPALIQTLLVDHSPALQKTTRLRTLLQTVVGNSLLTLEGADHHIQRRLLAPVFQPRTIAAHTALIRNETQHWLAAWPRTPHDVYASMQDLSLRLNHRLLFGSDLATQPQIVAAWTAVTAMVNHAMTQVVTPPRWVPTLRHRRFHAARRTLDAALLPLIQLRRHEPTPHDLISHVLEAARGEGVSLTDADIRDQVMAFFIAGHEPLAAALTWAWYVLATEPDITQQLRYTIDHAPDETPPALLTQTLAEVLRLYPPVYVFTRRVIAPIDLPGLGVLPSGLTLGFSPFIIQRNPQWYPNPTQFDPSRFAPEAAAARPRLSYIPFGIGAHQCIGMHLALQQLTTVMQTVLQAGIPRLVDATPVGFKPRIVLEPDRALLGLSQETQKFGGSIKEY